MDKNAQSAIEFIVILASVMLFFGVFLASIESNRSDKTEQSRVTMLNDIALTVKDEINLAVSSTDGYSRQFIVPGNVMGKPINVTIVGRSIYARTEDGKHALSQQPLTAVVGEVHVGSNVIEKINGTIYLNR